MKYLKLFEKFENITEEEIEKYLQEHFPSSWFDSELSNRVNDYIDEDDAERYNGDLEKAYKNLATGGAIEYDLIRDMSMEVSQRFGLESEDKIDSRNVTDICHDHLIDTCSWYDKFVFNTRSTDPYKSAFNMSGLLSDLDKVDWDKVEKETGFKL